MKTLLLVLGLMMSAVPAGAREGGGGWSSSGGDPLRFHFAEGRDYAADLLRRLPEGSLPEDVSPEVVAWFNQNRIALADDVAATEHEWLTGPQPTCALTQRTSKATVQLSFNRCRSISTPEEAGKLLIHESVHHFGISDEAFADEVAMSAVAAMEVAKTRGVPRCPRPDHVLANSLAGSWRVDAPLTRRLGGRFAAFPRAQVTFREDESALARFRGFGRCAFTAGFVTITTAEGTEQSPYALIEFRGETLLITDPVTGGENRLPRARHIAISKAADRARDLLFVGDSERQRDVSAFSRE